MANTTPSLQGLDICSEGSGGRVKVARPGSEAHDQEEMTTLAVHGHFYQPDRRDPATGLVPRDPTAAPAPDWNERITSECYAPNARLGNYARIGWDFGPTLLAWLRIAHPEVHTAVGLAAVTRGGGMAQSWHHTILPLASERDRRTEVAWGVADYTLRFGRLPAGFWLPECAVSMATLDDLAALGVRYVILAPWQAATGIDTRRPYRVDLPSGRAIVAVFYDETLSAGISFRDEASMDADRFVADWVRPRGDGFDGDDPIVLVATDGELYGHHKPFRDWFLRALPDAAARNGVAFRPLGEILASRPVPNETARIHDGSSWSCHHGVGRWSTGCACTPDSSWKPVLRNTLQSLADALDVPSEAYAASMGVDLWSLRDRYASVVVGMSDPTDFARAALAGTNHGGDETAITTLRDLLGAQRSRLAMFTSCAWFWDDPARSETVTALRYAADATETVRRVTGYDAEPAVRAMLSGLRSRATGESGTQLWERAKRR